MSRTKRKERPKIDKSYQFGNGPSTSRNNGVGRWELRLTLIMRLVLSRNLENRKPTVPHVLMDKVIKMINTSLD